MTLPPTLSDHGQRFVVTYADGPNVFPRRIFAYATTHSAALEAAEYANRDHGKYKVAVIDREADQRRRYNVDPDLIRHPLRPLCSAIPIVAECREAACREPYHLNDGIPYCDHCGLYRDTIAKQLVDTQACWARARTAATIADNQPNPDGPPQPSKALTLRQRILAFADLLPPTMTAGEIARRLRQGDF